MTFPAAILFDLDDTIISYDGMADIAWDKTCLQFIEEYKPEFGYQMLRQSIETTRKWFWGDTQRHKIGRSNLAAARRQIVRMALLELGISDELVATKMADRYSKLQNDSLCLFDGAYQALENIKQLNIRMAIITNGSSQVQRDKMKRFNITPFFEFILIDEEIGFSKPDIRIYEMVLENLSLHPKDVWMIGDNLVWDIEAPQQLGIYSVWNDFRQKGLPKDSAIIPDKIVFSIFQLSQELLDGQYKPE